MQITLALQDNSHHGADYYIIGKFPEQLKHLIKKTVRLNDGICTSINGAATAMYLEIMENGDLRAVTAVGNPEGYTTVYLMLICLISSHALIECFLYIKN